MDNQHHDEYEGESHRSLTPLDVSLGGATFLAFGAVDLLANYGLTGFVVGGIAALVAARHGADIVEMVRDAIPSPSRYAALPEPDEDDKEYKPERSFWDRALGRFPEPPLLNAPSLNKEESDFEEEKTNQMVYPHEDVLDFEGEDDLLQPPRKYTSFVFSDVQAKPSLDRIFLARTETGTNLFCSARDLCHVALAGNTGGGKSSIMRMLMVQLCQVRASILLLNPHYTRYDLDNGEDWTPFEPYLVYPPMECRSYEVIEFYLKNTAKELIPKRLERRAHSQPIGKPYFIVIDELPSIVREIENAPEYMRIILEEGRKVGVFLISAAQDFLVKTISPKAGGGSIRECYRTAYYVGGDPTTAKVLLDMPANLIPEDELGKGTVMLRSMPTKKAVQAFVPYVDNESVYRMLGPSTYQPTKQQSFLPEMEIPHPTISLHLSEGTEGNEPGNAWEMAYEAQPNIETQETISISTGNDFPDKSRSKPDVSDERLEMIRQMKERHYPNGEIATLVKLSGRKYTIYRQCLVYLGYAKESEK